MLIVRPAGPADIDALMELAYLSGRGFTSLPEDRPTLADRLAISAASFERQVAPNKAWYTLMLEDSGSGRIDGVAGVKGEVGVERPHFSFRVMTMSQFSPAIGTRFDHQVLVLVNECHGSSEVGSLFLRPGKRQAGAGGLLARSRYMLIGAQPEIFGPKVMAELRGWFDDHDNSPFWDGIASKFLRLPFEEADRMITSTDGQFIVDLAPRHPIYLELVDQAARDAIGAVHRHGVAALAMLESEGFQRSGLIDIFDGGPTVMCARDQIATLRERKLRRIRVGAVEAGNDTLIATTDLSAFRAVRAAAAIEDDDLLIDAECADALRVSEGDQVQARLLN
jgi:arginine N-succinyltransferase